MENIKEGTSSPMPELLTMASCIKTGRGSLLNRLSCPSDDPIGKGTEVLYLSLERLGRRGNMRDDSAEILFKSLLQEAIESSSGKGRDLHSLMLPSQHF